MVTMATRERAADQGEERTMSDVTDMIDRQCAENRARRENIPYSVALARVKADAVQAVQRFMQPRPQAGTQVILQTTPELPPHGAVTDVAGAKAWLSKHHPGWPEMGVEDRHLAAKRLLSIQGEAVRVSLARHQQPGKPILLALLYPGVGQLGRLRAHLAATVQGFDKLPYDDQCDRVHALRGTFSVVDLQEVAHEPQQQ
jgi:hypothetical protein